VKDYNDIIGIMYYLGCGMYDQYFQKSSTELNSQISRMESVQS